MENTKFKGVKCGSGSLQKTVIFAGIALAVILKLVLYYSLMGVKTGFAAATGITFAVTVLLFGVFKRKWIAAAIYLPLSILMAVDVNYFSFFNRNLSVAALGAANLLGGVTESIKELFMPVTLLIPLDAVIILVLCIVFREKLMEETECRVCTAVRTAKARVISLVLLLAALASLVLIVPGEDSIGKSLFSQEFYSYHLRDITGINSIEIEEIDSKDILAVEGNYENEKEGPDFGCGEGMNLIVVQVEAMQDFVIGRTYDGQEITPFINSLLEEDTFYFDSYYQQTGSGNTSDAEFAINNSLYGSMQSYTYEIFQDNHWRGLPVLLKEKGYDTMAFHAFRGDYWNREGAYPAQGFDEFYCEKDFDITEELGMGLSDSEFFRQSIDIMKDSGEPFYSFMVTLSSHYPFDIEVGDLKLSKEDEDTVFGNYLQSMNYVDSCFEELFEYLEDEDLADNTIVAFYGDHLAMNPKTDDVQERMSEYLGWDYSYEEAMNVPLVIHVPGSGVSKTIDVAGGQTDFLPTIAYIMGFDTLDTIYLGHNLCTVKSNFVPVRSYMPRGSFIMGDVMFKMSKSGLISDAEVINIRDHEEYSPSKYAGYYAQALQLQHTSDYYLNNDILRQVYLKGKGLASLVSGAQKSGYYSKVVPCEKIIDASIGEGKTDGLYCLENFDRLYEEGVRAFALDLIWTADGHTVVMKDWDELEKYFTKWENIDSYKALQNAVKYNGVDGITAMTGGDFIAWAQEHEDAVFFISIDDEELLGEATDIERIYFARTLRDVYPELMDRTVFIAEDVMAVEDYNNEDLYNVLFYAGDKYSVKDILNIDGRYEMYGTAVDKSIVNDVMKKWKNEERGVYVYTSSESDGEKSRELGITGVVIVHDSML
ncbi:MAG: hypothetical protein E7228_06615 [Clostridiales bacterium]|nr:hypothetical protein [Clostridiales bacterium]